MKRCRLSVLLLLLSALASGAPSRGQGVGAISPGAFGAPVWREPVANAAALPTTGNRVGDVRCTMDTWELYVWTGSTWLAGAGGAVGPQGPPGADGASGPQGAEGPAGADGVDGTAATISVGSVTTGAAGSSAAVINVGTSSTAVLDFTIPRGDTGATGADGAAGPAGDTGPAGATGATGPAGPVAGLDTQVVFNDAGAAAGDTGLTYAKTTDVLSLAGALHVAGAGSVSSSAISVVQTGTGLYQPAANVLGLAANGVDVLRLNTAISGVNYVEITPQATGGGSANGPTIKGTGSDASVDLNFDAKGTASRFQWKINGVTKMDFTDIGGSAFALRVQSGPIQVPAGRFVGSDSNNNVTFSNGGNWTEIKGNGITGLRVTDSSVVTNVKTVHTGQLFSVADNGSGTRATGTLTPTASYVRCSCADSNGCDNSLSETGAVDGQILRIVSVGANLCGFADTPGVAELAGAVDLGQHDIIELLYVTDRFVEVGRSDN